MSRVEGVSRFDIARRDIFSVFVTKISFSKNNDKAKNELSLNAYNIYLLCREERHLTRTVIPDYLKSVRRKKTIA